MNRKLLGAVALFAMFSAFDANAQTANQNLDVTAEVLGGCEIDNGAAIALGFGPLDPTSAADNVATTNFQFHCTVGTTGSIELGAGLGAPANYLAARVMRGTGTNTLDYRLETTALGDWGESTDPTVPFTANAGWSVNAETVVIQGRITQAQVQAAAVDATYQDTVLITLNF